MIFRSLKAHVALISSLSIIDSMITSVIKLWLLRMRETEIIWNVWLHPGDNHLRDTLGTQRGVPDLEAIIIPLEIREELL